MDCVICKLLKDGEVAGQEVFHAHLHVLPRFPNDGFGLRLPPTYSQLPERKELDRIAAKLRDVINSGNFRPRGASKISIAYHSLKESSHA